jgi:predicted amidophosphoribosyltransferase
LQENPVVAPNRRIKDLGSRAILASTKYASSLEGHVLRVMLKQIHGPWADGWVLDKHSVRSEYIGDHDSGHPIFNTTRTEVGEAHFQLKYRNNWEQAKPLAQAIFDNIYPKFTSVKMIVPMPASTSRPRQPVSEIAKELGILVQLPVAENVLIKAPNETPLKDFRTKEEKFRAIGDSLQINDRVKEHGPGNVLIVDDLFQTGASMEAACRVLRTYNKVRDIYVAVLTWGEVK